MSDPSRAPSWILHRERRFILMSFRIPKKKPPPNRAPETYQSSRYEPPTTYQVPLGWKGAPMERERPATGDFLNVTSRVPSEGSPPEAFS